jgi:translocation and assembly module TamB
LPHAPAGALRMKAELTGAPPTGGLELTATGERLRFGPSLAFSRLAARVAIAPSTGAEKGFDLASRAVRIEIEATDARTPSGTLGSTRAAVTGTLAAHSVTVAVNGQDLGFDATARGSLRMPADIGSAAAVAWDGTLDTLVGRGAWALRLAAPAPLSIARGRVRLGEASVKVADGNVHVDEFALDDGGIATRGRFAALPVATLARLAGRSLPTVSTLTIGGEWSLAATPRLNGTISLRREGGDVWLVRPGSADAAGLAAGITALEAAARVEVDTRAATATLRSTRGGSADATLSIGAVASAPPGRIAPDAPLELTLVAELTSLQVLQPWIGATARVDGSARLDVAARGTVAAAPLSGKLTGSGLRADAPQYGLHLSDGRLAARLEPGHFVLDELTVTAGDGVFRAKGTLATADDAAAPAVGRLVWHAERFRVFNRPDLRLVVSGDGEAALSNRRLALTGRLEADEGNIVYEPDGTAALGDDVVVKGWPRRDPEATRAADVPLAIDMDFDFGEKLRFAGKGLDTQLRGRINVRDGTRGFVGKGAIRAVNGTFFAYGQKLVIDPGRLVFDGPLDNPGLDIVALRKNLAVEAGVAVTGTVKVPILRLTSNPPVPDNEKLSWLVLGRGLNSTSGTDFAALEAASAALLGPGRKPVTTSVAQSVGVDDISFKSSMGTAASGASGSPGTQGQVVAIGKRLTENLTIAYEQSLTVAGNALRIEYNFSPTLSIRAEAGMVSGVGVFYRRSFE